MPIKLPAFLSALNYQDCLAIAKEIIENPAEIIEVDAGNLYRVDPFDILTLLVSTASFHLCFT